MSNTQNKQDVENKASLNKEDEAFVKFDDEQTEKKDENLLKQLASKADFENQKLKDYFISQKTWKDISKDLFVMLKESEKDAITLLMTAAQYSCELLKAKINK